jgi:hypothetical protein
MTTEVVSNVPGSEDDVIRTQRIDEVSMVVRLK